MLYSLHGVRHGPAELYSQDSLYSSYTALYSIQRYTLYTLYTIQRSTTTLCFHNETSNHVVRLAHTWIRGSEKGREAPAQRGEDEPRRRRSQSKAEAPAPAASGAA